MNMDMGTHGAAPDTSILSISPEHEVVIVALLFMPPLVVLTLALCRALAPRLRLARALEESFRRADSWAVLSALLVLASAVIHLALIPGHLREDPLRASLFAVNGVAFVIAAVAALTSWRWQGPTAALLVATVLAYVFYVATGREDLDAIGVMTNAVELLAVLTVAMSSRTGRRPRAGAALMRSAVS